MAHVLYNSSDLMFTCLVAFGEGGDEVVSVGLGGSLHHRLHGDVAQAVGDVFLHRPGKQRGLLSHESYLRVDTSGRVYARETLKTSNALYILFL